MTTTKKRILVSLSKDSEKAVGVLAKSTRVPRATVVAHLIDRAIELEEDSALSKLADERFSKKNVKYVPHEEVWARYS